MKEPASSNDSARFRAMTWLRIILGSALLCLAGGLSAEVIRYEVESDPYIGNGTGNRPDSLWVSSTRFDGSSANTAAHEAGYLSFGPYDNQWGDRNVTVTFRMLIDNNSADNFDVVTLDVFDATTQSVVPGGTRVVKRSEFIDTWAFQDFTLNVDLSGRQGHSMEARVYWHDISYVFLDYIEANIPERPTIELLAPTANDLLVENRTYDMKANASYTDGTILKVQFYDGSRSLGDDPIAPYDDEVTWTPTVVGTHNLRARVWTRANDGSYPDYYSDTHTVTVNPNNPPDSTLTSPQEGTVAVYELGQTVILKATVTDDYGVDYVDFYAGKTISTPQKISASKISPTTYAASWKPSSEGSYVITAFAYDVDGLHNTQSQATIQVNPLSPPTNVNITEPTQGTTLTLNQPVTVKATASDDKPGMWLELKVDGSTQDTANQFPYELQWMPNTEKDYSLQVIAHDSDDQATPSSVILVHAEPANAAPDVTIESPGPNADVTIGQSTDISVSASDVDGNLARVDLEVTALSGTKHTETLAQSPYTFHWTPTEQGTHQIKVTAVDAKNAIDIDTVLVSAMALAGPTVAEITSPHAGAELLLSQQIEVTVNVADDKGIENVVLYADTVPDQRHQVDVTDVSPYTLKWTPTAEGTYTLYIKAYDTDALSLLSNSITVTVAAPESDNPPTVNLFSPDGSVAFERGQIITLQATATDDHEVDYVRFYAGSEDLPIAQGPSSTYTSTWQPQTDGEFILSAIAFDSATQQSAVSQVTVTVNPLSGAPTVGIHSPVQNQTVPTYQTLPIEVTTSGADVSYVDVEVTGPSGVFTDTQDQPPYVSNWTPTEQGFHNIEVIAYGVDGQPSEPYSIQVNAQDVIPPSGSAYINFNNYSLDNYYAGPTANSGPEPTVSSDGRVLTISGNQWVSIRHDYQVTINTRLEFDFKSSSQGEIHAIGVDNDNSYNNSRTFELYGTQNWGKVAYENYSGDGQFQHFVIDVGALSGSAGRLFFVADDDANFAAESVFKDVHIYEEGEVNSPPGVTIQNLVSEQEVTVGVNIDIPFTASDVDGNLDHIDLQIINAQGDVIDPDSITAGSPYVFHWVPSEAGRLQIKLTAVDSEGLTHEDAIYVNSVTNAPPRVTIQDLVSEQEVTVGESMDIPFTASDVDGNLDRIDLKIVNAQGDVIDPDSITAGSPYVFHWTPSEAGRLQIVLMAVDAAGATYEDAIFVNSVASPSTGDFINFNNYDVVNYAYGQAQSGTPEKLHSGRTLKLVGNMWKSIAIDHAITPNTRLEFDFKSSVRGEIHGIGIDNNGDISSGYAFQLYGTESWGRSNYKNYNSDGASEGEYKHYIIDLSLTNLSTMDRLTFFIDDDRSAVGESTFTNVRLYEEGEAANAAPTIDNLVTLVEGTAIEVGSEVSLEAIVSDDYDAIDRVEFTVDGIPLPIATSYPYATTWTPTQTGHHTLRVVAYDDADQASAPWEEVKNVNPASTTDPGGDAINFNDFEIKGYGGQTNNGTAVVSPDGTELRLEGNMWNSILLDYTVTQNTRLAFDFMTTFEGEIHAIGVDDDWSAVDKRAYQLYGTETWANQTYRGVYSTEGQFQSYDVDVRTIFSGSTIRRVFFVMDNDASKPGYSVFRNVRLYEADASGSGGDPRDELPMDMGTIGEPDIDADYSVGEILPSTVSGSFGVSNGSMSYTIPIPVSPGRAGMQPELSINYTGGGNGILGLGWGLSGVTAITRCPATYTQDGFKGGINFDANDRYCLNGQRLIPVHGGINGGLGVEYRTEVHSYSRIRSYGGSLNNPAYWTVETKAGQTFTYGGERNATLMLGTHPLVWSVSEINDTTGNNPIEFNYFIDQNSQYLNDIVYPGGKVQFAYANNRPDTKTRYLKGYAITASWRLQWIKTYANSGLDTSYALLSTFTPHYQQSGLENQSVMDELQVCDGYAVCLEPLQFEWTGLDVNHDLLTRQDSLPNRVVSGTGGARVDIARVNFADFNGDGLTDVYYFNGYGSGAMVDSIYLATGNGNFAPAISGLATQVKDGSDSAQTDMSRLKFVDFNGDGLTDIYYVSGWGAKLTTGEWVPGSSNDTFQDSIYLAKGDGTFAAPKHGLYSVIRGSVETYNGQNGTTFTRSAHSTKATVDIARINFGDFNGDGLTDIYYITDGVDKIYLATGEATFDFGHPHNGIDEVLWNVEWTDDDYYDNTRAMNDLARYKFADFNGDGITDIYYVYGGTDSGAHPSGVDLIHFFNSNGDIDHTLDGAPTLVWGDTIQTQSQSLRSINIGDFNGDGVLDVYQIQRPREQNKGDKIYLAKGDGTYADPVSGLDTLIESDNIWGGIEESDGLYYSRYQFLDYNGDGFTDIYRNHGWGTETDGVDGIYLFKGQGQFEPLTGPATFVQSNRDSASMDIARMKWGDFNGDGLVDLYRVTGYSFNEIPPDDMWLNNQQRPLLTGITSASGIRTDITYKPLTDSSVYTKCPTIGFCENTRYPYVVLQTPIPVVAEVKTSDGIGGTNSVQYHYEGLKVHARGRGMLGYAKVTESYPQTGKTLKTEFYQHGSVTLDDDLSSLGVGNIFNYDRIPANDPGYSSSFPLSGAALKVTESYNGDRVNESFTVMEREVVHPGFINEEVFQPLAKGSIQRSYGLGQPSQYITQVVTQNSNVDGFGNIGTIRVDTTSGLLASAYEGVQTFTQITESEYDNVVDSTRWFPGRLKHATVTHRSPYGNDEVRQSYFTYYGDTGLLNSELVTGKNGTTDLVTTHYYNPYGQEDQVRVRPNDNSYATRFSTTVYENGAVRPSQSCNALGECMFSTYTPQGWLKESWGPNQIKTRYTYDGFGNVVREDRADGTWSVSRVYRGSHSQCGATLPGTYSCSVSQTSGGAPAIVQKDALGREIRTISTGFDGRAVYVDTEYDSQNNPYQVSQPYFAGANNIARTTRYFDEIGRVKRVVGPGPDGVPSETRMVYDGLKTTVFSGPDSLAVTRYNNAIGQMVRVEEEEGTWVDYTYNSEGNVLTTVVHDNLSTIVRLSYDEFGRKERMIDPDVGEWSYTYTPFGELETQTDAKGQTTTMRYDVLGRMVERTEAEGTSTWVYYGSDISVPVGGRGKLHYEEGLGIRKTYSYDDLGRPTAVTTDIDGEDSFVTETEYDNLGRVKRTHYPGSDHFFTENVYDNQGFLTEVRGLRRQAEPHGSSTDVAIRYWQLQEMDAAGRITSETYGNGITNNYGYDQSTGHLIRMNSSLFASNLLRNLEYDYDAYDNVLERQDNANDILDKYTYDRLHRLVETETSSDLYPVLNKIQTLEYYAVGNIKSKSDVGDYVYGARPHAVLSAGAGLYSYDANGNMKSGDGRTIAWSSFNKPTHITQDDRSATFSYGFDHARYKKVNHLGDTTLYINSLYERTTKGSGATEEKHFIYAAGKMVAEHILSTVDGRQTRYLHQDALNSIDTVTDASAEVVERRSFDSWGELRDFPWREGASFNDPLYRTQLPFLNQAYTGHEQVQEVDLIHMNGRMYDAKLARFISADPFIQAAASSQSYNRYSYVFNNPHKYTDPSGFISFRQFFDSFRKNQTLMTVVGIAAAYFTGGAVASLLSNGAYGSVAAAASAAATATSPAVAATAATAAIGGSMAGGFVGGLISSGGDLKSAVMGGIVGGISANIGMNEAIFGTVNDVTWQRVLAHGVVGGASSVFHGGKFGRGFMSSAFAKAASGKIEGYVGEDNAIVGGIGASVLGGTTSVIGGGKFGNAAATASFQYLFNQSLLKKEDRNGSGIGINLTKKGKLQLQATFRKFASANVDSDGKLSFALKSTDLTIKVTDDGIMFSEGGVYFKHEFGEGLSAIGIKRSGLSITLSEFRGGAFSYDIKFAIPKSGWFGTDINPTYVHVDSGTIDYMGGAETLLKLPAWKAHGYMNGRTNNLERTIEIGTGECQRKGTC